MNVTHLHLIKRHLDRILKTRKKTVNTGDMTKIQTSTFYINILKSFSLWCFVYDVCFPTLLCKQQNKEHRKGEAIGTYSRLPKRSYTYSSSALLRRHYVRARAVARQQYSRRSQQHEELEYGNTNISKNGETCVVSKRKCVHTSDASRVIWKAYEQTT